MTPTPVPWLFVLLAMCAGPAWSEKADRDKPMNVEADALRYDDVKKTNVFSGRVVLTKGSIVIRGERIEVSQDAQGHQSGVVSAAPGQLAFFRQKREGVDEFIEGEAQTIDYDGRLDAVKLIGQAQLRRYLGARLNDEFKAATIVYNNTTEVFTLDGVQPGSAAAGRVRAVLTPRAAASAAAAASGALLRPSPQLGTTTP